MNGNSNKQQIPGNVRYGINADCLLGWGVITTIIFFISAFTSMIISSNNYEHITYPIKQIQKNNTQIECENIFWKGWAGLPVSGYNRKSKNKKEA